MTAAEQVDQMDMNKKQSGKRQSGVKIVSGLARFSLAAGLLAAVIAAGFLVGGFLKFTDTIASYQLAKLPEKAAGIVAYTGGSSRIEAASGLLRTGKGQRMLISGVYPKTSKQSLLKRSGLASETFDCCVDIDKRASDTHGNATETAKWARKHNITSLIIVTSTYHMPRSLLETRHELPEIELVPYPVISKRVDIDNWYRDRESIRHLLSEYMKYVAVQARPFLNHSTISTFRASLTGN